MFIEARLKLKVNHEKTEVSYIGRLKFLGYGFYVRNGKCRLRLHQKTEAKLRRSLKAITSRSTCWVGCSAAWACWAVASRVRA